MLTVATQMPYFSDASWKRGDIKNPRSTSWNTCHSSFRQRSVWYMQMHTKIIVFNYIYLTLIPLDHKKIFKRLFKHRSHDFYKSNSGWIINIDRSDRKSDKQHQPRVTHCIFKKWQKKKSWQKRQFPFSKHWYSFPITNKTRTIAFRECSTDTKP